MTISASEDMGLVDTNVLIYRADQDSAFHLPSVNLINMKHFQPYQEIEVIFPE